MYMNCTIIYNIKYDMVLIFILNKGLQSELDSSNKEGDLVRVQLQSQKEEIENIKQTQINTTDEEFRKYGENK